MKSGERKNSLHTKAFETSKTVVLIIDVINPFEFEDWESLVDRAARIVPPVRKLKREAHEAQVPIIYVNDNFGQWRSNAERLVEYCSSKGNARKLVQSLAPDADDYFVLKPMHSGFFETPLSLLLRALGTRRLVLSGLWTNSCVLFTAHDAYMRDYHLTIPKECVAAPADKDQRYALNQMRTILKAEICSVNALCLSNKKAS